MKKTEARKPGMNEGKEARKREWKHESTREPRNGRTKASTKKN
jgi:hypothetical protein